MEKTISLRFKYTEEEYAAAMRLYLMRSPGLAIRFAVCSLYAVACFFLLSWLGVGMEIIPVFAVAAFLPFILAFLLLFVVPHQRFRSDPKFQDEYLLQFSDGGIHFKTPQIDSLLQWSIYNRVLENERFFILVYGKNTISVIPKRAFSSANQVADFKEMLRRNLPACFDDKRLKEPAAALPESSYTPPPTPPNWR
jgi:hypothetical protein